MITASNDDGFYGVQDSIFIEVDFQETVSVSADTSFPYLLVHAGDQVRSADYFSGSGSEILVFEYTVQTGDYNSDLYLSGTNDNNIPYSLNGAEIIDSENEIITFTLPLSTSSNSLFKMPIWRSMEFFLNLRMEEGSTLLILMILLLVLVGRRLRTKIFRTQKI